MSEHTKTPWEARFTNITQVGINDTDDVGPFFNGIIECKGYRPIAQANARHIVHCVNNHERLVEALRNLEHWAPYDMDCADEARALLAELEAGKEGE